MYIHNRKTLCFQSEAWIFGDYLYYIRRLPATDLLVIEKDVSRRWEYVRRVVKIADFIMAHATNRKRSDAAHFVFYKLEWHENICIRSAYELDKIGSDPDYARSHVLDGNSLRIVNGQVWTRADYEIERDLSDSIVCKPFDDYPGLDYGVLTLAPYLDPRDAKPYPLLRAGKWNDSPNAIAAQLDRGLRKDFKRITALRMFKDCAELITRM